MIKKFYYSLFLFILIASTLSSNAQSKKGKIRLIDHVNVFIGTGGHGHTYPGATLPFGMSQLSPDNLQEGWDWSSGYHYSDSVIAGFSHTHLSGTGIGDLCDISVMPLVNISNYQNQATDLYTHQKEKASPGYYQVYLKQSNIDVHLTATKRTGFHKYVFPQSKKSAIAFDLGFRKNWDGTTESEFKKVNDSTYVGFRRSSGWASNHIVYFAARLNKKIERLILIKDSLQKNSSETKGKKVKAILEFETANDENILLKVGLSTASYDGAIKSLEENTGWDFDKTKSDAEKIWEKELSKIIIKTPVDSVKTIFYTSLYHTYLAPTLFSDANSEYKGVKSDIEKANHPIYSTQSLWDTFRAANPLLTLTQKETMPDFINSLLTFYKQYGLLPVWDLQFNETGTMTGYHAVAVVADAILKNIDGFDYQLAYQAMKKSAMQDIRATDIYRKYGYVPHNLQTESVTITLEYAYDDWCIAKVAQKLNYPDEAKYYFERANNYKNLFDTDTNFFRPKLSDGTWLNPFDPLRSEFQTNPYTEGNAWQHTFFVPHDVYGMQNLFKDKDGLEKKLDSLFSISSKLTGNPVSDITGMIGQYAHGNEPSHHIAYLYSYLNKPWKTAEIVRKILNTQYKDDPDGLSGNDDCGQMSAWYVFSALGFYPSNSSSGEYVFGSPILNKAEINLGDNKKFVVNIKNADSKNIYIKSIKLNGKAYDKTYLTHQNILDGGKIDITMSAMPDSSWGTSFYDRPSSMSKIIQD